MKIVTYIFLAGLLAFNIFELFAILLTLFGVAYAIAYSFMFASYNLSRIFSANFSNRLMKNSYILSRTVTLTFYVYAGYFQYGITEIFFLNVICLLLMEISIEIYSTKKAEKE
jgi:hypothetical protein